MLVEFPTAELAMRESTIHKDKNTLAFRLLLAVNLTCILGALLDFFVFHKCPLLAYLLVNTSITRLSRVFGLLLS